MPDRPASRRHLRAIICGDLPLVSVQSAVRARGYATTGTDKVPNLDELIQSIRDTDQWYMAYVDSLSPPEFSETVEFVFTDGSLGRMSREEIFGHVIVHEVWQDHHVRDQVVVLDDLALLMPPSQAGAESSTASSCPSGSAPRHASCRRSAARSDSNRSSAGIGCRCARTCGACQPCTG